jgi:hypothetical protein
VAGPDQSKQVVISDPETGVTYLLDPVSRTARKMPALTFDVVRTQDPGADPRPSPPPAGHVLFFEAAVPRGDANVTRMLTTRRLDGAPVQASQSLGTQTFEGVLAEGTRSTLTIAAGQIGNERPIEIVSERWFSPELKTLVLSKQSDPRFGDTTYALSNIVLGDPEPSLFDVPADYQVVEAGSAGDVIFRRRVP